MPGDGLTIKRRIRRLLRSPAAKNKKSRKESLGSKVTLEKVLGITATGNSGLACDPRSGLVAYPAGCVVVLLNPKKNRQHHIINASRKAITALSFSPDGRYLVTGESGHLPAVRLWDVAERRQVADIQKHKYGVSCVAFSPDGKYVVSVGNQHDMMVNVWAWKRDLIVAANKVSSKVTGVSFSEDSSYFVTVGSRHVKFWYLDHCRGNKASTPVPLLGRSGLLGELRNNFFSDVACGRGARSDATFCITSSGLLCELNGKRTLDKWVDLQTSVARSLCLSEDMIFCGCADGTVRIFRSADLHFIGTLPRPHPLGSHGSAATDASHAESHAHHPDAIAVTLDPLGRLLSCVYNDHSVYAWDVRDVHRVGRVYSALFHASCVWDLETFPDVPGDLDGGATSGDFLTCSADNTIRLWRACGPTQPPPQNVLGSDLFNVLYMDANTSALLDSECAAGADKSPEGQSGEIRTGVRTICVSPDGRHLASGDRNGVLRVHDLGSMEEILKVEAHDAEILCLEYSKPETGLKLLATASRDRLIHVLDAEDDYSLLQTLDEHSSSITAVRFAANDGKVRMISCGADKSIYFRTAHKTDSGTEFRRSHHLVRKTTLYDMDVDITCKYAAVGCQDRCIRIFNVGSGKQKKLFKGSLGEDGSLLKVQIDPSGQYVATSCSDKNISIFDFYTGECVATMFGHSEIVTGMKFTNDCRHLISVSGDSCIFVWRLAPELTIAMRERLFQLRQNPNAPPAKASSLRLQAYGAPAPGGLSSESDREHDEEDRAEADAAVDPEDNTSCSSSDSSHGEEETGGSDEAQDWKPTKPGGVGQVTPDPPRRPRRRWSHRMGSLELMVKSMLDLRQLETFAQKKCPNDPPSDRERQSTTDLQESVPSEEKSGKYRPRPHADWLSSHTCQGMKGTDGVVVDPEENQGDTSPWDGEFTVKERHCSESQEESRSPDSAGSLGYGSRESSPNRILDDCEDVESLSHDSSDDEDREEEEEQTAVATTVDEALRMVTAGHGAGDFLKRNFEALAEACGSAERTRVQRISMSSRFLAGAHHSRALPLSARASGKEQGSAAATPLVSKVRPLMEDGESRTMETKTPVSPGFTEGPNSDPEKNCAPKLRPLRKKNSGSHLWRLSTPPSRAPPLFAATSALHKSLSAQNLSTDSPHSTVPSSERREPQKRPQPGSVSGDTSGPSVSFSSPSSGSLQSLRPPPPWDSPKLKPQHSYMNPTASSMAKSTHSSSLVDDLQMDTPPPSPKFPKGRRFSEEPEVEPPCLTSPPVTIFPSSIARLSPPPSKSPSPTPVARAAAVLPTPLAQNAPPSRIPLPKQPLGPRRSLCLEVKPSAGGSGGASRSSTPTLQFGCDGSSAYGMRHASARPSLSLEPYLSLVPGKQKSDSVSQSVEETGQAAAAQECPLVPERTLTSSPQPDRPVTLEACRQVAADLRRSLKKTVMMYTRVLESDLQAADDRQEMSSILSEALLTVKSELDSLAPPATKSWRPGVDEDGKGEGDKTMALLEQYAELLLKSVEKRLDAKS